jgi:hypothetical protein
MKIYNNPDELLKDTQQKTYLLKIDYEESRLLIESLKLLKQENPNNIPDTNNLESAIRELSEVLVYNEYTTNGSYSNGYARCQECQE